MKPASFTYHRPSTLEEALKLLQQHGEHAKLLAGGQSMVPMLNLRLSQPQHLIDLNDLMEWGRIKAFENHLEIGGLARHSLVASSEIVRRHCPLMAQMAATIGHDAIRHRGTVGGSLAHADPAAQMALMAVTLGAQLQLLSLQGERTVSAEDFFLSAMTTAIQPHELLRSIRVPVLHPDEVSAHVMFNQRHGDYALVAVALTLRLDAGMVTHMRLGISGVADQPIRLTQVEKMHTQAAPDAAWKQQVAQAVLTHITPEDDPYIPASYRKDLAVELTLRALDQALAAHNKG